MNNLFNRFLAVVFAFTGMIGVANAQASWTKTTLSAALDNKSNTLIVASATGITAPGDQTNVSSLGSPAGNPSFTFLYIDKELFQVLGVNSTTIYVKRAMQGTAIAAHVSGATVYVGPPEYFSNSSFLANNGPSGACTASAQRILPVIVPATGDQYDCRSSGQWIKITGATNAGSAARAFCTGTVGSGTTDYLTFAACSSATSSVGGYVVDSPGTLASLYIVSSAAVVGGTNKDVATVLKNGSATALTCTIAASGTTCNDLTHSVTVAAGDVLTFKFVTATSDTAADVAAVVTKY